MVLGFAFYLTAIMIFGFDCWNWSTSSDWAPTTLWTFWNRAGIAELHFGWSGLDSLQSIILHLPLAALFGAMGLLIIGRGQKSAR